MNSLRVKKENIYRIEVNDDGEYIEFDLEDVNLNMKFYKAIEDYEKLQKKITKKEKELKKKNADGMEFLEYEQSVFKEMRKIMDSFLGENACKKIFGARNTYNMFYDLLEELDKKREDLGGKSHLEMLEISADNLRAKIISKYSNKETDVI